MKLLKTLLLLFAFLAFQNSNAQDDLLGELDSIQPNKKQIETAAFKGLQICNIQSTKLPVKGEFYFLVSHRFGDLSNGINNFFGLDNALTKIAGIYGVTNWLSLGLSRHTYGKTYELAAKYKLANQMTDGFPFTIVGYNTMDINSELDKDVLPGLQFNQRLAYTSQLLFSRKFNSSFSLQLAPIYVYKNLYDNTVDQKDMFLFDIGGRYKISKRLSLNVDYATRINKEKQSDILYHDPLTFGLDIETGGHVFQLVFSNSQPMNDVATFTNTTGKWFDQGMYFGFNMYRVF
jgi:hypothetical protein